MCGEYICNIGTSKPTIETNQRSSHLRFVFGGKLCRKTASCFNSFKVCNLKYNLMYSHVTSNIDYYYYLFIYTRPTSRGR